MILNKYPKLFYYYTVMSKRKLDVRTLGTLFMLLMSWCQVAFAGQRSEAWSLNPSDYRYDMSLYLRLNAKECENLDVYEVGAFIGDECRGLAEKLDLPGGESCLYMRIRSNSTEAQEIVFRLREKESGNTVILQARDGAPFLFKADEMVGLPSDPYLLYRFFNVTVTAEENGSVEFENGLYAEGTVLELTATPAEGYHVDRWSDGSSEPTLSVTVDKDIDLSVTFAPNIYKVVFMIGEDIFATLEVPFGGTITAPEVPEREGYTFSGWSEIPETMPAHDIEIKGEYTVNIYKAVFVIENETVATLEVPFGQTVEAPEAPEREGYSFSWIDLPETMPAHDIEIKGEYTVNKYRLTVYLNNDIYMDTELNFGQEIVIPDPELPENMIFDGWKEEIPATMPAHDIVIHGTTSEKSALDIIAADSSVRFIIYNLNGVLVYEGNDISEAKEMLPNGLYIANGRKILVK